MHKHFEALESRELLSAPTATVQSTTMRPDQWLIVVRYADADQAINPATIGADDITVNGPNGYSQTGTLWQSPIAAGGGAYLGVYAVPAPFGAWDYGANGVYTVSVNDSAVSDAGGEVAAAASMRTYNLWFNNPAVRVARHTIESNMRWWEMALNVGDNMGIASLSTGQSIVEVTAPDGSVLSGTITSSTRVGPRDLSVVVRVNALGRLWDYTDNGQYTVRLLGSTVLDTAGTAAPAHVLATCNLWFSNPKIEIVDSQLTDSRWTLTLRYSDDQRIEPTSFYGIRPSLSVSGPTAIGYNRVSTFESAPSENEDGSYTVVVYFTAPRGYWTQRESGQYRLWSQGGATDIGGLRVGAGQFAEYTFDWSTIDAQLDRSTSTTATASSWDVELTYRAGGTLTSGSFADGDLAATGPGSTSYSSTLISAVQQSAGVWRVRYRFTPGAGAFTSGSYVVSLVEGAVTDSAGGGTIGFNFTPLTLTIG